MAPTWFVATMDESIVYETDSKRDAVRFVDRQGIFPVRKRERAGQYRYESYPGPNDTIRTYYVMTKERAFEDGWTDQETEDGYIPLN